MDIPPESLASNEPQNANAYVLIAEDGLATKRGEERQLVVLTLPRSAALLVDSDSAAEIRVVALDSKPDDEHEDGAALMVDPATWAASGVPLLEPLRTKSGEALLMVSTPESGVLLNGMAPPILAPLEVGDQIAMESHVLVHVSRSQRVIAIPTPEELVGTLCCLCLSALEANRPILRCPKCASPRHLDGDDVAPDRRLQCAEIGPCPECETELPTSDEQFAYWPAEA